MVQLVHHNLRRNEWMWVWIWTHQLGSLIPRPPRPAFVACSTKSGGRPGRIYHVMRATADITFSLLTSGFVLSPSLFFPCIQFVLSVQFVLWVWLLLDRSWLATVCDISRGMYHVINLSRPSPRFSYCKRQKLGVEVWEQGYQLGPVGNPACTHATQAHHLLTVEHRIHPMYVYIRQESLHWYRHTYRGRKSFNDVTDSEGTACLVHLRKGKKYEWQMSAYDIPEQASRI